MSITQGTAVAARRSRVGIGAATRTVVAVFGVLAALAGAEHGLGAIVQGPVRPERLVIRSWPEHAAFDVLDGEPAMTLIPNLLVSGVVTVMVSATLGAWVLLGMHRRHRALVLAGLSVVLLGVGGGFGPPLVGLVLSAGASRLRATTRSPAAVTLRLARVWPWALAVGSAGYLGLVPGVILAHGLWGTPPATAVYALMVLAFCGLVVALVAARARDRSRLAWQGA